MTDAAVPPQREELPEDDNRSALVENVREAMGALPFYFTSPINIEGLDAGDLFALNSLLGGAIEIQTVDNLSRMREVWDPDEQWQQYGFKRFPQSFPDVRLVKEQTDSIPALGIELKGWYLLSKESVPSFRFAATRSACSPWDLIAVVPWTLSNVLSGTPMAHKPFVEQARYAADMRTYYWQHLREDPSTGPRSDADNAIASPTGCGPYPRSRAEVSDKPAADGGGNFGRLARVTGLMDEWIEELLDTPVSGIPSRHWIKFLAAFSESKDPTAVSKSIETLLRKSAPDMSTSDAKVVVELIYDIGRLVPPP